MAERRLKVEWLPPYGVPYVSAMLDRFWEVSLALTPGDRSSILASRAADSMFRTPSPGRRLLPTDVGIVVARIITFESLIIPAHVRQPIEIRPFTFAVGYRPEVLGLGGTLGRDFFSRFRRISFEQTGTESFLTLED